MLENLKSLRAKYDEIYHNLLKDENQASSVKDKRIAAGKSRAVLDIVEMLERMIDGADAEHNTPEATAEALNQVRAYAREAKERENQPVKDEFTASMCLGYRLGYDLILQDLDTSPDLVREDMAQQHGFPITPETLQQLPPFVAAMVNDYTIEDEAQRWSLHDIQYDVQTLDALPIDEGSTCEIWTYGWVWRGRNGIISLSPHILQPQVAELGEAFAWVVEHENTDKEHIRVWRIRCQLQLPVH